MCSDCEVYGLKKHGLTKSDYIWIICSYWVLIRYGESGVRYNIIAYTVH